MIARLLVAAALVVPADTPPPIDDMDQLGMNTVLFKDHVADCWLLVIGSHGPAPVSLCVDEKTWRATPWLSTYPPGGAR